MDANVMKRIIVLKNLKSNMIEEAYIVFKNNSKIYKYEKINEKKSESENRENKDKNYMIKEAEMIINDYICKMESKEFKFNNKSLKRKNTILKISTMFFALLSICSLIMFIIK